MDGESTPSIAPTGATSRRGCIRQGEGPALPRTLPRRGPTVDSSTHMSEEGGGRQRAPEERRKPPVLTGGFRVLWT